MTSPVIEVRSFVVTIPASTALASPLITDITMPAREVQWVTWRVPSGPAGLMGWRLTMSNGNPVIPVGGGWIIADGNSATWNVYDQPDGGAWEVTGYNTDIYPHSVYLDFGLTPVSAPASIQPQIPSSSLGSTTAGTTPALTTYQTGGLTVPAISVPAISVPAPITAIQPVFVTAPPVTIPPFSIPGVTVPTSAGGYLIAPAAVQTGAIETATFPGVSLGQALAAIQGAGYGVSTVSYAGQLITAANLTSYINYPVWSVTVDGNLVSIGLNSPG